MLKPAVLTFDLVSTRSRPKAADFKAFNSIIKSFVSTRSRPKAAEWVPRCCVNALYCFNTQPPEGG